MCKAERKEIKKENTWNRKHFGKKLAKMYEKFSKMERKLFRRGPTVFFTNRVLVKEYEEYLHKCFMTYNDKYFWRGDYYRM